MITNPFLFQTRRTRGKKLYASKSSFFVAVVHQGGSDTPKLRRHVIVELNGNIMM
jgi:hypothetical protein